MDKKYVAYGLIGLNVLLQIVSCFWYSELPGFVWTVADAIVILVPLVFGLQMGLLCLLPVAGSELLWFFQVGAPGPLLHLASFTIAVFLMAAAHRRLAEMPREKRAVLSGILFIAGYAGEELLYHGLRLLVLQKPVNWKAFFGTVCSPVIPIVLILLVIFVYRTDRGEEQEA